MVWEREVEEIGVWYFKAAIDYFDFDDSLVGKHSPKTGTGRVNLCALWHRGITNPLGISIKD